MSHPNKEKELAEIQFSQNRREIFINESGLELEIDEYVIVEAEKGENIGFVSLKGNLVRRKCTQEDIASKKFRKILRPATEEDVENLEQRLKKERESFNTCKMKIIEHKLPMKLVDAEILPNNAKIMFYFTADQRVDFRELVKDLASTYHTRIELRQIGVRDEARRLGGLGICGQKQCCTTFIGDFEQVTTQMAKEQQLSINPSKISGNCGRLMCCLRYETDFYREMAKECPLPGSRVKTKKGEGTVTQSNIYRKMCTVKYGSGDEENLPCGECCVIRSSAPEETSDESKESKEP